LFHINFFLTIKINIVTNITGLKRIVLTERVPIIGNEINPENKIVFNALTKPKLVSINCHRTDMTSLMIKPNSIIE
jgi:hypothetical protein